MVGSAVLSLAGVGLLATWAPLALIPFGLAIFAVASRATALVKGRRSRWEFVVLAIAIAPVPLYILAVTLPDAQGETQERSRRTAGSWRSCRCMSCSSPPARSASPCSKLLEVDRHQLIGVLVICAVGAAALGYLVLQRLGAASLWGYYPAKFSWFTASLLLVILTAALASEMADLRGRPLAALGAATVAFTVPVALMMLVPPWSVRTTSYIAPVAIATHTGIAVGDPAAERLFELAESGHPTMALSYLDAESDRFLDAGCCNSMRKAPRPIRSWSYSLEPGDLDGACEALRVWETDTPVRIVTSDPTLVDRFECAGGDFRVDVVTP